MEYHKIAEFICLKWVKLKQRFTVSVLHVHSKLFTSYWLKGKFTNSINYSTCFFIILTLKKEQTSIILLFDLVWI